MDIALVTGADAGPGLAIARRLIGMGCRVYALATQFARNPFPHDDFIPLSCDLADSAALTKVAEDIVAREGHVSFVVHAARRVATPLLDSPVSALAERLNVGLLAPLALARVTLPWLRKEQGHFVVLCWNGDGPAPGGPVTAAIEGGLHHFADALFDELRSDGVRATTIYARPNEQTSPEAALALDPQSAINPELVAEAVENLFRSRPSNVVTTLVIRPAALVETPRIMRSAELAGLATRDVQLPSRQNFPREPERIPTPIPARPADAPPPGLEDFEDEDEDEDFDPDFDAAPAAQEREGSGGPPREGGGPQGQPRRQGEQQGPRGYDPDRGHEGGRRRGRRRRGGRGRGPVYYDERGQGSQQRRPGGPPEQPQPPVQRPEYPDAEAEAEERAFARDDSFRTPHSESDEDNGGGGDDAGHAPEHGEGREEHREERPAREENFREEDAAPVTADSHGESAHEGGESREAPLPREPRHHPAPHSPRSHHGGGEQRGGDGGGRRDEGGRPQGGGQGGQHGGGPRRHRGFGRRPPPGGGRGPGRE